MKENIYIVLILLAMMLVCALMYVGLSDNAQFKLPNLPKINILNSSSIKKEKNKDSKEESKKGSKNTLVCTKSEVDEDGFETKTTLTINHKNNKVIKVKQEDLQILDEESVDFVYGFGSIFATAFSTIEGINAVYEKVDNTSIKSIMEIDYTKLDYDSLRKTIEEMNSEGGETDQSILSTTKEINIDEFKKEYLEGYTCN